MSVAPITLTMIGVAVAGENPLVPDAASAGAAVEQVDAERALWTSAAGSATMAVECAWIVLGQTELRIARKAIHHFIG